MDALQHWAASWLFAPPGRGYFVILSQYSAYFDESGIHDTALATAIAGHLASVEEWKAFDAEWNGALSDYGVKCFHMKRFNHSRDDFEGWDKDQPKRRAFLGRLLSIIERRTQASFVASATTRDFQYANAVYPLSETGRDAYVLCGLSVIDYLDEWRTHLEPGAVVKFIFEDGAPGAGQLSSDMRRLGRGKEIAFEEKCPVGKPGVGALQAADLDAYEHSNFLGDVEEWIRSATEPHDLKAISNKIRYPFKVGIARTHERGDVGIATVNLPAISRLCDRLGVKKRSEAR